MPTICHLEIPAENMERAAAFYSDVFGWKFQEGNNPHFSQFSTTDAKGEPGVGGMLMERQGPHHVITNYIDVPSIDEFCAKIEKAGGKIRITRRAVPGRGYYAVCFDSENNMFGIWENNENAK